MYNNEQSFASLPDLYKILECNEDASPDIIKKQYRKLSLIHHPDKNQGNSESVEKFKSINMAYQILSNKESKEKYDNRHNEGNMRGHGMQGGGTNMEDIMKMFFSTNGSSNSFGGRFPFSVNLNGNSPGNIHIFRNGQPVNMRATEGNGKPPTIQKKVKIPFITAYNGGQIPIEIERWTSVSSSSTSAQNTSTREEEELHKQASNIETRNKENETVYIEIPKGIDTNEVITITGKGNVNGDVSGDVKVIIEVEKHDEFRREGLNLIYVKTISFKESICGFESIIRHVSGKQLRYKSDPGQVVRDGVIKTIQGLGMHRNNHVGSLIVKLHIDYSKKLTEDQIRRLSEIL